MKKTLIVLAMVAAFGASAQTTVDSTSGSQSQSGAISGSQAALNASNSGNVRVDAVGNQASSASDSRSQSGASSGSQSGAYGNSVEMNNYAPEVQTVLQDLKQSATIENKVSGGTHDVTEVRYSGTQTVKNVPSIAMSGPASGPCTGVSGGIGIAGPGWGFGANGSSVMADCRLRENVRVIGMAMQSLDGQANPQEKGEATVLFMEALRGLAAYNNQVLADEIKPKDKK